MQSLDILREYEDGSRRWIEAATDVDEARERVRILEMESQGLYVIFNQRTQQMVSPGDHRKEAASARQVGASD